MAEFIDNRNRDPQQPADHTFNLAAVDSANRMTRSLSPWVQEMLGGGSNATNQGSLVRRLLLRRTHRSVSFHTTIALLKRFHRIATRTSAWKADVGTISPNLFEQFSDEMFKNWEMGANNISALLKINRQEEAIDMPLAGEAGGPVAAAPQKPTNPALSMTMEEIRRRVEEARSFESMSPSAVPNFVKSQDAAKPDVRPVAQHPGSRPTPAPPRPTDQPIARSLPGQTPAAQQPAEQPPTPAPRMMRRRMARKVEYLSMPASEGSEGSDSEGSDDSDSAPHAQFDTGPPGLDWLFTPQEDPSPDWFAPIDEVTIVRQTAPQAQPALIASLRSGRQAVRALSGDPLRSTPSRSPRRAIARAARPVKGRRPQPRGARTSLPSIAQRAVERLAASASGQLLAGRPQLLLDYIQQQSIASAQQPQPAPSFLSSAPDNPLTDDLSFVAEPAQQTRWTPIAEPNAELTPVSLTDFALPYTHRLWQRASPDESGTSIFVPAQPNHPVAQPGQSARRSGRARIQPASASPVALTGTPPSVRTSSLPGIERRPPLRRERTLAALQSQPLRPPPTVMRLVSASPLSETALPLATEDSAVPSGPQAIGAPFISDEFTSDTAAQTTSTSARLQGTESQGPERSQSAAPASERAVLPASLAEELSFPSAQNLRLRPDRAVNQRPAAAQSVAGPRRAAVRRQAATAPGARQRVPEQPLYHRFAPVSGLWRADLLRRQPQTQTLVPSSPTPDSQPSVPDDLFLSSTFLPPADEPDRVPERVAFVRLQPLELAFFQSPALTEAAHAQPAAQPIPVVPARLGARSSETVRPPQIPARSRQQTIPVDAPARLEKSIGSTVTAQAQAQSARQSVLAARSSAAAAQPLSPVQPSRPLVVDATAVSRPRTRSTSTETQRADRTPTPVPTLIERVIERDFAGTRGDLLAGGPLALRGRQSSSVPVHLSPKDTPQFRSDARPTRTTVPGENPPRIRRASTPRLLASARAQTRLLIQRGAATDGGWSSTTTDFWRRPRGLRAPTPIVETAVPSATASVWSTQPAPSTRGETVHTTGDESILPVGGVASGSGRLGAARVGAANAGVGVYPPAISTRLGETAGLAQRLLQARARLEPVSALWRMALLAPATELTESTNLSVALASGKPSAFQPDFASWEGGDQSVVTERLGRVRMPETAAQRAPPVFGLGPFGVAFCSCAGAGGRGHSPANNCT